MQLGMVGLGRMGGNMTRRLIKGGHELVVWDRDPKSAAAFATEGATAAGSLEDLVARLAPPRAVWIMVPAGAPTESTVEALGKLLAEGDAIIDGGNSYYKDDVRRAAALAGRGVGYLDAGTSGGLWGLERGYCLMVGGAKKDFQRLEPVFKTLAPGKGSAAATPGLAPGGTAEHGYLHCGPAGAGHFVKMVHNGIEYGLMQAYGEGLDILRNAGAGAVPEQKGFDIDVAAVAELWRRGSVVASWLLDLTAMALAEDPKLARYEGFVQDSGEGRWTIEAAIAQAVPADVLTASLFARFRSRKEHTFAEKVLSAMREKFGGHAEKSRGRADAV